MVVLPVTVAVTVVLVTPEVVVLRVPDAVLAPVADTPEAQPAD